MTLTGAAGATLSSPLHAGLRQGIESALNLDHGGASAVFHRVIESDREGPIGYAFLALPRIADLRERFPRPPGATV